MLKKAKRVRKRGAKKPLQKLENKVKQPVAKATNFVIGNPRIGKSSSIVIAHTEFLDDVNFVTLFDLSEDYNVYELNPGLTSSFPWLGTIAAGFEQYRWKKLKFRYLTRSSATSSGTIIMATQKDSADPMFASKEEMYAYSGVQSNVRWNDADHDALRFNSDYMKKYFVRTSDLKEGQDAQLYDYGKFTFIGLNQTGAAGFGGELMVEYEVELFNPKMNVDLVGSTLAFEGKGNESKVLGDADLVVDSGLRNFVSTNEGKGLRFNYPGIYQVGVELALSAAVNVVNSWTAGTKFSQVAEQYSAANVLMQTFYVWTAYPDALFNYGLSAAATTISKVKVSSVPMSLASLLTWGAYNPTTNPQAPPPEEKGS